MKTFQSALHPVYLDHDHETLIQQLDALTPSSVFVLADTNTARYCVPLLHDIVPEERVFVIAAGEQSKTLQQCEQLWSFLLKSGADRQSVLLNVGGGMVGDLGGFAASCFQRGIRFVQVPTTVLAMTDASIGGKTGVDFEGFKNQIGVFNTPQFIWIHTSFLQTLSGEEKIGGLAEIVKHAVIASVDLFEKLEHVKHPDEINWADLLEESIAIKLALVETDPLEKGKRKVLNFGHTIGHALESYFLQSSTPLSHGQAVTLGMLAESKMALEAGLLPQEDFSRIIEVVTRLLSPLMLPIPDLAELQSWLKGDKKNINQNLSFSLPDTIGSCTWDQPGPGAEEALNWLRKTSFR